MPREKMNDAQREIARLREEIKSYERRLEKVTEEMVEWRTAYTEERDAKDQIVNDIDEFEWTCPACQHMRITGSDLSAIFAGQNQDGTVEFPEDTEIVVLEVVE